MPLRILSVSVFAALLFCVPVYSQYQNIKMNTSGNPEEVSIAINPANPNQLAAGANINYMYYSNNGGLTWTQKTITSSMFGVWGDPCLIYNRLGQLFYGHLSYTPSPGYWIDRIVVQRSTDNGLTWNQGAGVGFNSPKEQDKEWIAVDMQETPYRDNLYMCWTEFDNYGSTYSLDSSRILSSRSTDHGLTWSAPVRVSDKGGNCVDEDLTVEGAVPTVGPNGEIYTCWSGPLGLIFDKSTNGGLAWGADIFVATQPGGWDITIPGIQRANGFPVTVCDTSRTSTRGNIYINWSDQRNGTDNTDIFFVKSLDGGNTWTQPLKVNNDNTTRHQFYNWMAVDQVTGFIYIVFYDRRSTTGSLTDVYVAKSVDGGQTFENFKVSTSSFNPVSSVFFGDYSNIAAYNRKIYPMWTRLDNTTLSVWTALVTDSTTIVPVELSNFNAVVNNGSVLIKWETASELNNLQFELQRKSVDGLIDWTTVGVVKGKGTTTTTNFYSFTDVPAAKGTYKYRLKQSDLNGQYQYSNEIEVVFDHVFSFALMQNYPNPFNPSTTISYQMPSAGHVTVKVYDMLGKEINTLVNEEKSSGIHEINFNGKGLSSGMYTYRIQAGNYIESKKMILLK